MLRCELNEGEGQLVDQVRLKAYFIKPAGRNRPLKLKINVLVYSLCSMISNFTRYESLCCGYQISWPESVVFTFFIIQGIDKQKFYK